VEKLSGASPERELSTAASIYNRMVFGAGFPEFPTLGACDYPD
jgi:hypothetical protein